MADEPDFLRSRNGSVAIVFAVVLVPVVALVGLTVDYVRATSVKAQLQKAADAAVLQVRNDPAIAPSARPRAAETMFLGLVDQQSRFADIRPKAAERDGGIRLDVTAQLGNAFGRAFGFDTTPINVTSEAVVGGQKELELALVLDTTGSMRDDMTALRQSAESMVEAVMSAASGHVRIAVVPYVAAVNVGRQALAPRDLDLLGASPAHAFNLKDRFVAHLDGCSVPGAGGGPPAPLPGDSGGNDKRSTLLRGLASLSQELFGIRPAKAQTPSTARPIPTTRVQIWPPYSAAPMTAPVPVGFPYWYPCNVKNPMRISNWDLFQRIPNVRWKGCVEARAEPFDVTDEPPNASDPRTLFAPYFFPDMADWSTVAPFNYPNNYMPDGAWPAGLNKGPMVHFSGTFTIFKYDGVTPADIDETPPFTRGPNAGCPDEMLQLTSNRQQVIDRIRSLNHWETGGTVTSEGVAWGWRALSPKPPLARGKRYGETEKVMVVMSDGMNTLAPAIPMHIDPGGGPTISDYSAYGWIRYGRFGADTYAAAESFLNERMRLVCDNAKKAGITIYTVLFRETAEVAKSVMRQCASDPRNFFHAADQEQLRQAFARLGSSLTQLRLSR